LQKFAFPNFYLAIIKMTNVAEDVVCVRQAGASASASQQDAAHRAVYGENATDLSVRAKESITKFLSIGSKFILSTLEGGDVACDVKDIVTFRILSDH
jgi:hypothetical protein